MYGQGRTFKLQLCSTCRAACKSVESRPEPPEEWAIRLQNQRMELVGSWHCPNSTALRAQAWHWFPTRCLHCLRTARPGSDQARDLLFRLLFRLRLRPAAPSQRRSTALDSRDGARSTPWALAEPALLAASGAKMPVSAQFSSAGRKDQAFFGAWCEDLLGALMVTLSKLSGHSRTLHEEPLPRP